MLRRVLIPSNKIISVKENVQKWVAFNMGKVNPFPPWESFF